MSDAKRNQEALKALRQQRGATLGQLQTRLKEQIRIDNELTKLLKEGPRTVPDLAGAAQLPTETVFWHLIALKKYGKVVEAEQDGDYFQYRLTSDG